MFCYRLNRLRLLAISLPFFDRQSNSERCEILPPAVFTGQKDYPAVLTKLKRRCLTPSWSTRFASSETGQSAGSQRDLPGSAVQVPGYPCPDLHQVLKESLKPKLVDINMKAFEKGRSLVA